MQSLAAANEKIRLYTAFSLAIHIALLLLTAINGIFFPAKPMEYKPTVQVDIVALPDQTKIANQVIDTTLPIKDIPPPPETTKEPEADKQAMAKPESKAEKAKKEAKVNPKDARSALQKLKDEIEKESRAKADAAAEKKRQAVKEFEARYRSALRGNQLNSGSSTDGALETVQNAYVGHIVERIRANWSLPTYLRTQNLRASVIIYIDNRGVIYRHVFRQVSGNEQFDDFIRTTLQRASPLAPPPSELAERLKQSGMELLFPL